MGSLRSTFWSEKKNFFLRVRMAVSVIPCSLRLLSGFNQFTVCVCGVWCVRVCVCVHKSVCVVYKRQGGESASSNNPQE